MNYELRTTNQHGLSSLLLLFMVVLGVFILWEANAFINHYSDLGIGESSSMTGESGEEEPICLTGEEDNCNDSNDVFILNE